MEHLSPGQQYTSFTSRVWSTQDRDSRSPVSLVAYWSILLGETSPFLVAVSFAVLCFLSRFFQRWPVAHFVDASSGQATWPTIWCRCKVEKLEVLLSRVSWCFLPILGHHELKLFSLASQEKTSRCSIVRGSALKKDGPVQSQWNLSQSDYRYSSNTITGIKVNILPIANNFYL